MTGDNKVHVSTHLFSLLLFLTQSFLLSSQFPFTLILIVTFIKKKSHTTISNIREAAGRDGAYLLDTGPWASGERENITPWHTTRVKNELVAYHHY